jgi:hypothetical protein
MDLIYFRHPQDLVFDAETKAALHTEMAKKNLFVKRGAFFLFFAARWCSICCTTE